MDQVPLLQASDINRTHGGKRLLRDISIELHAGERLAIFGETGSGKSLLLRTLAMLDPVDSGTVLWRGQAVTDAQIPAFRSQCIYLHQRPAFRAGTVADILCFPFTFRVHQPVRYDRFRIQRWLESAGRDDSFLDQRTENLSGGEMQLVALLRALQLDPSVLLLDEPTSALDARAAAVLEQLIQDWLGQDRNNRAYIIVSHDRQQVSRLSDRQLFLDQGQWKVPL